MANFITVTASNSPRLQDPTGAGKVLARYCWDGDVEAVIHDDRADGQPYLAVYGYDWPGAWKLPDGASRDEFEPDYDLDPSDGFEQFLREIAPCLAEPLTVQAVGFAKCRFPLAACEWYVPPGATEIEMAGFKHSQDEPVRASKPA